MDDTFYSWSNDKTHDAHSVIAVALTTTAISKRDRLQFHRGRQTFHCQAALREYFDHDLGILRAPTGAVLLTASRLQRMTAGAQRDSTS
jgi:hypothetical protein